MRLRIQYITQREVSARLWNARAYTVEEVCTNVTLVVIHKLHGDKLCFPRLAARLKPTGEEAQAISAFLVALSR